MSHEAVALSPPEFACLYAPIGGNMADPQQKTNPVQDQSNARPVGRESQPEGRRENIRDDVSDEMTRRRERAHILRMKNRLRERK